MADNSAGRKHNKNLYAAILLIACGAGTVLEANTYPLGTLSRMGPGYYPAMLGIVLLILGLLIAVFDHVEDDEDITRSATATKKNRVRGLFCIIAGMVAFMVLGRYGGLVPATFALVFIAAMGDTKHTLVSAAALATGTAIVGALIFVWGLQLQLPAFQWG